MGHRAWNFSAGPSMLPQPVLEYIQAEILDWNSTGSSVMEVSHRSKDFVATLQEAQNRLRDLLSLPSDWHILWTQGGARAHNAFIPLNFMDLKKSSHADYVISGHWSCVSYQEALRMGFHVSLAAGSVLKEGEWLSTPDLRQGVFNPDASYVHLCWNETVHGIEYAQQPTLPSGLEVPLVMDVSSNILSRPIDFSRPACFYAGAQKNIGIAGLTVILVHDSLLGHCQRSCPQVFNYTQLVQAKSCLNTLPTFAIYVSNLVFDYLLKEGGVEVIEKRNQEKAHLLYEFIDQSDFYFSPVSPCSRSRMNVVFHLKEESLLDDFLSQAQAQGLTGLKGHSVLGGLRASIYNAMPLEGVQDLMSFMQSYEQIRG